MPIRSGKTPFIQESETHSNKQKETYGCVWGKACRSEAEAPVML